jgi:RNA 2',3'-cyclic 3'-phosphodiesterase
MPIRTFICLELPAIERARLGEIASRLRRHRARVSWVPAENLHLTLAFLGDVDDEQIPAVVAATERAAGPAAPLQLRLGDAGAFPSLARPRVLWVGVDGDTDALASLHRAVSRELDAVGLASDAKPFRPHLTIGRVKDDRDPALGATTAELAAASVASEPFAVDDGVVMRSDLEARGARHTPLARLRLGALEAR